MERSTYHGYLLFCGFRARSSWTQVSDVTDVTVVSVVTDVRASGRASRTFGSCASFSLDCHDSHLRKGVRLG